MYLSVYVQTLKYVTMFSAKYEVQSSQYDLSSGYMGEAQGVRAPLFWVKNKTKMAEGRKTDKADKPYHYCSRSGSATGLI